MADRPAAEGKKLFGLPRKWALVAVGAGVLIVVYYYYRSRQAGASAQAALPASSSLPSTDTSTAAPALGGTPDTGTAAPTLTGSDLVSAFNSEQSALLGGFQSQQQLISQLSGGYEQLAMTSDQQLGALAAGLINLIPQPGSTSTSRGASSPVKAPPTVASSTSYDVKTGATMTPQGVTIQPTVQYSSGPRRKQVTGPSIMAFK